MNRRAFWVVLGMTALGACSPSGVQDAGPAPTRVTTSTSTPPPSPAATVVTTLPARIAATPTTAPTVPPPPTATTTTVSGKPVYSENGIPQVTATPAKGPVGTLVQIEGWGFAGQQWQGEEKNLVLSRGTRVDGVGCAFFGPTTHRVLINAQGHLTGWFVVPAEGGCRMTGMGPYPVAPGEYAITMSCSPCFIGLFEVTV